MNGIVNKFLLAADKFMFKMDIRQPRFTYSACRPLLKIKKKYKNLMKQEIHDKFIKTN